MNRYYLLLILGVVIASFSQVLLKMSARRSYDSFLKEYMNHYVIIGYAMMVCSTLFVIAAYHGLEYKNGPIIESLGYILVMVLSFWFFGERVGKRKLLGYALILAGVVIFYI